MGLPLSSYLRGLALDVVVQGAVTAAALFLIDVPYPLLFGILVAVADIVPYMGALLGAVPGVIVAFFVSPATGLLAILVYVVIQQLDAYFISPRVQGQVLRIHPVIVLLAVLRVLFDFFRVRLSVEY